MYLTLGLIYFFFSLFATFLRGSNAVASPLLRRSTLLNASNTSELASANIHLIKTTYYYAYLLFFSHMIALYACIAAPVASIASLNTTFSLCIGAPNKGFSCFEPAPSIIYKLGTSYE